MQSTCPFFALHSKTLKEGDMPLNILCNVNALAMLAPVYTLQAAWHMAMACVSSRVQEGLKPGDQLCVVMVS